MVWFFVCFFFVHSPQREEMCVVIGVGKVTFFLYLYMFQSKEGKIDNSSKRPCCAFLKVTSEKWETFLTPLWQQWCFFLFPLSLSSISSWRWTDEHLFLIFLFCHQPINSLPSTSLAFSVLPPVLVYLFRSSFLFCYQYLLFSIIFSFFQLPCCFSFLSLYPLWSDPPSLFSASLSTLFHIVVLFLYFSLSVQNQVNFTGINVIQLSLSLSLCLYPSAFGFYVASNDRDSNCDAVPRWRLHHHCYFTHDLDA